MAGTNQDSGDLQEPGRLEPTRRGRIGLIVAGSLAAGLVAALILVAAPFIAAQENALTGAVLLGFASVGRCWLCCLCGSPTSPNDGQPRRPRSMGVAGLASLSGSAAVHDVLELGMAASPVRAGRLDIPAGPTAAAQPRRAVAAVPRPGRVGARLHRRRLRDRARVARRQGLPAARPTGRRGWTPAAPALHRLGQPHSRPGTGSGGASSDLGWIAPGRGPRQPESAYTTAPAGGGATPPTAPRTLPR